MYQSLSVGQYPAKQGIEERTMEQWNRAMAPAGWVAEFQPNKLVLNSHIKKNNSPGLTVLLTTKVTDLMLAVARLQTSCWLLPVTDFMLAVSKCHTSDTNMLVDNAK